MVQRLRQRHAFATCLRSANQQCNLLICSSRASARGRPQVSGVPISTTPYLWERAGQNSGVEVRLLKWVRDKLHAAGCGFVPAEIQGPTFRRPVQYIATSILESCATSTGGTDYAAVDDLVDQISTMYKSQEKEAVACMKADEKVRGRAAAWFGTVGRQLGTANVACQEEQEDDGV